MAKKTSKTKKARSSTALVHRPAAGPVQVVGKRSLEKLINMLPPPVAGGAFDAHMLTEDAAMGSLGLVEIKLTDAEEAVLARPVERDDVRIKPSGQPYLPHAAYTKWFNDAFGRLGWTPVPCAKPAKAGASVIVPYLLFIHGQPAAFAWGEQEYFEGNHDQTYGDAVEATVASALRRFAKRMGVGLELWNKRWIEAFVASDALKVRVAKTDRNRGGKKMAYQWRLKSDPPFYNEVTAGQHRTPAGDEVDVTDFEVEPEQTQRRAATAPPPAATHAYEGRVINADQRRRLWTIATNSKRSHETVKAWLKTRYGLKSSKDITNAQYDEICQFLNAPGMLPLTKGRS